MKLTKLHQKQAGFTLVEMAIVLTIVALLMAGLLPTISGQIEQQRRNETRKKLDEIQQALIGYAVMNGSLPCPTTQIDPANANYGSADTTCAGAAAEGYLPWKTLGVTETDAWGSKRVSPASPWTGYWRYRVDRNFSVAGAPFSLTTSFSVDALSVVDNSANLLTSTTERPIAIVYSTGPNGIADGQNASYEPTNGIYQSDVPSPTFDDILIWISRPQLFNRMVAAGKLP
jgi:prepilin-type N-terminal cleavage/methylation domain-containing protein